MSRPWQHLLACFLFGIVAAAGATESQNDESDIRDVQVRQARAWNSHDAGEYASLFTEDGDVVNVLGWCKAKLSDAFAWVFRDSTLTIDDV
ncbi:MAG: SgcJ/EcaC family oxidoreductase [Casimicrobiaceae bacterium]